MPRKAKSNASGAASSASSEASGYGVLQTIGRFEELPCLVKWEGRLQRAEDGRAVPFLGSCANDEPEHQASYWQWRYDCLLEELVQRWQEPTAAELEEAACREYAENREAKVEEELVRQVEEVTKLHEDLAKDASALAQNKQEVEEAQRMWLERAEEWRDRWVAEAQRALRHAIAQRDEALLQMREKLVESYEDSERSKGLLDELIAKAKAEVEAAREAEKKAKDEAARAAADTKHQADLEAVTKQAQLRVEQAETALQELKAKLEVEVQKGDAARAAVLAAEEEKQRAQEKIAEVQQQLADMEEKLKQGAEDQEKAKKEMAKAETKTREMKRNIQVADKLMEVARKKEKDAVKLVQTAKKEADRARREAEVEVAEAKVEAQRVLEEAHKEKAEALSLERKLREGCEDVLGKLKQEAEKEYRSLEKRLRKKLQAAEEENAKLREENSTMRKKVNSSEVLKEAERDRKDAEKKLHRRLQEAQEMYKQQMAESQRQIAELSGELEATKAALQKKKEREDRLRSHFGRKATYIPQSSQRDSNDDVWGDFSKIVSKRPHEDEDEEDGVEYTFDTAPRPKLSKSPDARLRGSKQARRGEVARDISNILSPVPKKSRGSSKAFIPFEVNFSPIRLGTDS